MKLERKIVTLNSLKRVVEQKRRRGKKIAFTNGCFDIIHFGHVQYLQKAKKPDRVLIVGINSDSSVKKLKGPKRPIVPQAQRAAVVAALNCVDCVTIFNEETPYRLIAAIQPDILIKGADWKGKVIVGEDVVKKNKGRIELIKYVSGLSTTALIEKIKNSFD